MTASADAGKRKLLDLTKQNRALNLRVNEVLTVTIVDEQPAEVFRRLYLAETGMKFRPAPEDVLGARRECAPRNRAGLRIPADWIALEEWRAAVLAVLNGGIRSRVRS